MGGVAFTPKAPYYAVIFTSERTPGDNGYAEMAREMLRLAGEQPGFLGVESARDGIGITVSYWDSLEAIDRWRQDPRHRTAQARGYGEWYESFALRVCRVERDHLFTRSGAEPEGDAEAGSDQV